MKFAICNEMFEAWPWDRTCDFLRELGYTGVEVAPFTFADRAEEISPEQRRYIRSTAEERGLTILGLHWLLVKPAGLYITHPDAEIRRLTAEYFVELTNLCADLGGKVMVIGSPKQRSLMPGVTAEQAMAYLQEVITPSLDLAAKRNVTLAIEPLGPAETNFLQTAEQAIELIHRVNHPAFRLNLDVKAMTSEAIGVPEVIRKSAPYIAHVQVNDPNLLGPGMGNVEYGPIIAALREVGYDGWLSVEAFDFRPGPENIARKSIEYLKKVVGG